MKGKELSYEEIIKLPHLTTVWEDSDYFTGKCKVNQEGKFITEDEETINMGGWTFDDLANEKEVQSIHISIYEWIDETPQPKTYTGSEILHMVECGKLKDGDVIIDKDTIDYNIVDLKEIPIYALLKYAPFTIKERPKEVTLQEALLAYIKGKQITSLQNGVVYKYYTNEVGCWHIESATEEEIKGKWIICD